MNMRKWIDLVEKAQSDDFKRWFAGSKVVDANGEPAVMYHGTEAVFDTFYEFSHFGTARAANERIVNTRLQNNPHIIPVYLRITRPIRVVDNGLSDNLDLLYQLHSVGGVSEKDFEKIDAYAEENGMDDEFHNMLVDAVERQGYDGIVYKNIEEDKGQDSFIPLRPTQVRSAFTVNEAANLPLTKDAIRNARGNYAAFIVVMDPVDFILLTSSADEIDKIYSDKFAASVADYKSGAHPTYNMNNYFMPFLEVDFETGKVRAHEGRHRAAMVAKEGGKRFPCAITFRESKVWICSYEKTKFIDGEFDYDHSEREEKEFSAPEQAQQFVENLKRLSRDPNHDYIYSGCEIDYLGGGKMKGSPRSSGWDYDAWKAEDMPKQLVGQYDSSVIVPVSKLKFGPVKGHRHFK